MEESSFKSNITDPGPRITVFIPAFNSERYIGEAIESVLTQSFTDFELLVIDDGSTDGTPDVIQSFTNDKRLRIVIQKNNLGRPRTRNHGLDLARGEYIALLDADDRCTPHRLQKQIDFLDEHRDIDGIGGRTHLIDDHSKVIKWNRRKKARFPAVIACRILSDCPLAHTTMMIRMSALSSYRYNNNFPVAQDYELFSRMIPACRFAILPETFAYYRQHAAQAGQAQSDAQAAARLRIYGHLMTALGVDFNQSDLIRHECLFKHRIPEHVDFSLDINFLRWARNWLESLLRANEQKEIYPEPEFSSALAKRWLFVCRQAVLKNPRLAWQEARGSSLWPAVPVYWKNKIKQLFIKEF